MSSSHGSLKASLVTPPVQTSSRSKILIRWPPGVSVQLSGTYFPIAVAPGEDASRPSARSGHGSAELSLLSSWAQAVYVRPALPSRQVHGLVVADATHGAAHTRTRVPPGSPVGSPEVDQ